MTVALTVSAPDAYHELLIAELSDLGFDAFEQDEGRVVAYGPLSGWGGVEREAVAAWLRARGLPETFTEESVEAQNWNRQWEESIQPITVGRFVIAPTWADTTAVPEGKTLLRVDPKMSFGTGYHESTRLALRFLPGLVRVGTRVLDAGTGTGILAIAALRLDAALAIGFDIDPWSVENATENAGNNMVLDRFEAREGGIEVVPEAEFGLVFANINRDVLLALLPDLAGKMAGSGYLVLAGLLQTDRERMLQRLAEVNLTLYDEAAEGEWWACVAERA